jgi:endogenous inhibitor of DNA gyrase (YacG/DUF329 family)
MGMMGSPWNGEGPLRAGFRARLCLSGWQWADADSAADAVVQHALRQLGCAERPTWEMGQPDFAQPASVERERCVYCAAKIPDNRTGGTRGRWVVKYCSEQCAQAAYAHRARAHLEVLTRAEYLARCATRRAVTLSSEIDCPQCARPFRAGYNVMRRKFCSKRCADLGKLKRRSTLPERACVSCGETFSPKSRNAKYCSSVCYMDLRARAANEWRGVDRQCEVCSTIFRVHSAAKPQRTCSRRCGWMLRRREAGSNAADDAGQSEDPAERRCAA